MRKSTLSHKAILKTLEAKIEQKTVIHDEWQNEDGSDFYIVVSFGESVKKYMIYMDADRVAVNRVQKDGYNWEFLVSGKCGKTLRPIIALIKNQLESEYVEPDYPLSDWEKYEC